MFDEEKVREFEKKKALRKAPVGPCVICGDDAAFHCPCETVQYCSKKCLAYRGERGHWMVCRRMREEQKAAVAARAEAPTPPPSPPSETTTRANPAPEPLSSRVKWNESACAVCLQKFDVNINLADVSNIQFCCARATCLTCCKKQKGKACPLCWAPEPTPAEALAHLRRHVKNEQPAAIHLLAGAYLNGYLGVVKSAKKALKLFNKASALGYAEATFALSRMYLYGDGVDLDKEKWMQLWRLAADQGDAKAQCSTANCLHEIGNFEEAFLYCKLAAEQGHTNAEYMFATFYIYGKGVECDIEEGRRWCARAAAKGQEAARNLLEDLDAARNAGIVSVWGVQIETI